MIEKILKEINRLKKELDGYSALEALDYIESYINMESYINTLPEEHFNYNNATITPKDFGELPKETLEDAAVRAHIELEESGNLSFINTFSKGAEWQEKKMLGIAEAFYEQGRFEQKQEMMKDVMEGEYWIGEIHLDTPIIQGYDGGDRIKFIPIKYE